MKNPHRRHGEGQDKPENSLSQTCPYARECHRWTADSDMESATCAHCYQTFDRTELWQILAGRA
jgi:hypothetical protein